MPSPVIDSLATGWLLDLPEAVLVHSARQLLLSVPSYRPRAFPGALVFPLAFVLEDPLIRDWWGLFQASLSIGVGSKSSPLHYYALSYPVASMSLSAERMTRMGWFERS